MDMDAEYMQDKLTRNLTTKDDIVEETCQAIALARQGLLSPYQQVEAMEAIRTYNGIGVPPGILDYIRTTLDEAIASMPQITDVESVRVEVEGRGGTVWLCYRNGDHNTMIDIIGDKSGGCTAVVYIDEYAASGHLNEYATKMTVAMNKWINEKGIQVTAYHSNPDMLELDIEHFNTVGEAAGWVLYRLQKPEDTLC